MNKPAESLEAFEAGLAIRPKRLNALYGAGIAAEKSGNKEKAIYYFQELTKTIDPASTRKEIVYARSFARN
jgi:tetratricopeptide (TPR) repeat protein